MILFWDDNDDSPIQQYQQSGRAIEKLSERNIQVHAHKPPSLAGWLTAAPREELNKRASQENCNLCRVSFNSIIRTTRRERHNQPNSLGQSLIWYRSNWWLVYLLHTHRVVDNNRSRFEKVHVKFYYFALQVKCGERVFVSCVCVVYGGALGSHVWHAVSTYVCMYVCTVGHNCLQSQKIAKFYTTSS